MKIGILTYHWVANFGANLQALSTFRYLKNKGHLPLIINWVPLDCELKYLSGTPQIQLEAHSQFCSRYFNLSVLCRDSNDIYRVIKDQKLDAIIIGSDSLFNLMSAKFNLYSLKKNIPTSDHVFPNPFWGEFCKDITIPIAVLSVSNQNSNFYEFEAKRNEIYTSLKRFSYISVRDEWTRKMVYYMSYGQINPLITPDPVFMFNYSVGNLMTKEELCKSRSLPERYILISFSGGLRSSVSNKWLERFVELAAQENIKCVGLPRTIGGQHFSNIQNIELPISPIEWYYLIKYSVGYVGVLMHPIIVALHNVVPFFSFDHYGKRKNIISVDVSTSKIFHILKEADLLSNYYNLNTISKWPAPEKVFESLIEFDKNRVKSFSDKQCDKCIRNYENILNSFLCV